MKLERLQEIYSDIQKQVIPLPKTESISYHEIVAVHQKCNDFTTKLMSYLIEVTQDVDQLKRVLASKKDFFNIRVEEVLMENRPEFSGCTTDTAKRLRAKHFVLKKEGSEICELEAELLASEGLQDMIREHKKDLEGKNNTAKKFWEMHNTEMKMFNASTRPTTPVVFSDPFVENVVQGTAKGTDETLDNTLGAEVDFQANTTQEAAPGDLYKTVEPKPHQTTLTPPDEKSKVDPVQAPIIKEEGGDLSAILDSL